MTQTVLTLVFSIVMLMFTAYPAKLLTDVLHRRMHFSEHTYTVVLIGIVIILSLGIGLFLRFA